VQALFSAISRLNLRRIVQGVEMGRRSVIDITAEKRAGRLGRVTVAGAAVEVSSGRIAV
jgi:trans-2,3-dihydro-3-hydroxyanthranilate isomerase